VTVGVALVAGLWGDRAEFADAFGDASAPVLATAVAMQLAWLLLRTEAWNVCVGASGGAVDRRRLYRASAIGYLGNQFNPNFGVALRIAALRRSAPTDSPPVPVLIAAEMPIIVIELALVAICSFTLIAPLGIPWWAPLALLAAAGAVVAATARLADGHREGFWRGLAVLRGLDSRRRVVALTVLAVSAQVLRNWLILRGLGVDVSVLDAIALLIGNAAIGLLPLGPTAGVVTSMAILGSNGVAVTAAAGALLTTTGAIGSLIFAAWALLDGAYATRPEPVAPELPA
jgi:uncharacterized membrane protein YbhN (UPF0104 family)